MKKVRGMVRLFLLLTMVLNFAACGSTSTSGGEPTAPSLPVQSVGTPSGGDGGEGGNQGSATLPLGEQNPYTALPLPNEMRAMWISFLEWGSADVKTEVDLRAYATKVMENSKALGMNTVIVAVRGFADAFYRSDIYPWSHLLTGTQGVAPGGDPLAILAEEAHARGLRIEAMVNPYRARHGMYKDIPLAAGNPAALHPDWVRDVNGTLWFNPGLPEVEQTIVQGVQELAARYEVDGIQFDDYFYPAGIEASFDADAFAQYGEGKTLADWRRQNISRMVQRANAAIKAANPTASFGISPAGNNQNNYGSSYADVNLWLGTAGYVDYMMPQLYWGFNYTSKSGDTAAAFGNKCDEWAGLPRAEGVRLYAGLAAYAIKEGDGGTGEGAEWQSGCILADMVSHLRTVDGFSGFALFRYDYLFDGSEAVAKETAALQGVLS